MQIVIRYIEGCPNYRSAVERVREALGTPDLEIGLELVADEGEAARLGFRGSPTILVDGRDPFEDPAAPHALACRLYATETGFEGSPSVSQLRKALST